MRIYLVRHGETEWNIQRRMQGWENSELTSLGKSQALTHGEFLHNEGVEEIYASDLQRVKDTVAFIGHYCTAPVSLRPELRECSMGLWEGFHIDEIKSKWAREYKAWREGDDSISSPEGESLNDVKARVSRVLDEVLATSKRESIAFVTHGLTTRVLLDLLKPLSEEDKNSLRIYNDVVHLVTNPGRDAKVSHFVNGSYHGEGICAVSRAQANKRK